MKIDPDVSDETLLLGRQLGLDCCYVRVSPPTRRTRDFSQRRSRVEDHGLSLSNAGKLDLGKCADIIVATAKRDARIDEFRRFLDALGEARIGVTTFTWEQVPTGTWNSGRALAGRSTPTRHVAMSDVASRPFTHDRRYTKDEIRDSFACFAERVLPSAEDAGVRRALHPNDPPVEELGGA